MTRLQRLSLASLIVSLVLAALVVPWSLSTIQKSTQLLAMQQEALTPTAVPTPDPQVVAARQYEAMQRQEEARASAAQAARIKAELDKVAAQRLVVKRASQPVHPAYSFAAPGPELMPLEGWVDQPNKDRPGRIHTNLMVRHVKPSAKPRTSARAPCLTMVAKPAERIERPYGWLEVPARTIPVPCGG